jgi:oxygen-independent coproporphyrinogen-3 oxidase
MDDGVLREMGRIHGAADSVEAVSWARGAGFDNVSIDLILGWPGESASRWTPTLDAALDLAPDHVSLYVLEVDGRNVLSHRAARGRLVLPPDDLVADLYETTIERLEAAGLRHYEISNWAKPGFESRHNAKYWADEPFLGFGLSAHSYSGGVRSWNHATLGRYCDSMEKTGAARAGSRALGPRERVADALFTGLRRRDGIGLAAFRDRYGVDAVEAYGDSLREAFSAGLLEADADRMRLTRRGLLVSNEVFRALV